MGKASKGARLRSVRIKVVRCITGPWKVSYLSQGLPQLSSSQTGPSDSSTSVTPREAEPDDVTHSCGSCTETAYSKAKRRELNARDAEMHDTLKVSFKCSAPITTQGLVCREHGDYGRLECSATAVFCECCPKRTHKNLLRLPDRWNTRTIVYPHTCGHGKLRVTLYDLIFLIVLALICIKSWCFLEIFCF